MWHTSVDGLSWFLSISDNISVQQTVFQGLEPFLVTSFQQGGWRHPDHLLGFCTLAHFWLWWTGSQSDFLIYLDLLFNFPDSILHPDLVNSAQPSLSCYRHSIWWERTQAGQADLGLGKGTHQMRSGRKVSHVPESVFCSGPASFLSLSLSPFSAFLYKSFFPLSPFTYYTSSSQKVLRMISFLWLMESSHNSVW